MSVENFVIDDFPLALPHCATDWKSGTEHNELSSGRVKDQKYKEHSANNLSRVPAVVRKRMSEKPHTYFQKLEQQRLLRSR